MQIGVGAAIAAPGLVLILIAGNLRTSAQTFPLRAKTEAQVVAGEVKDVDRVAIQLNTGALRATRSAFGYRSMRIDGVTFWLGRGRACSTLPHADFDKPPIVTGDFVRVTHLDGLVIKIELQAPSNPVLIPCLGLSVSR